MSERKRRASEDPSDVRLRTLQQLLTEGGNKARREAIKILRTCFWYERIRASTGLSTAYAVGRLVQPKTYRKTKNKDRFHHNMWAKYACGEHAPRARVLALAELSVPGSIADFHHILFDVLDPSRPIGQLGTSYLARLQPSTQHSIFQKQGLKLGLYRRRSSRVKIVISLSRQGDIDAVAGLIVFLREAHEAGANQLTLSIANLLYRTLIAACTKGMGVLMSRELGLAVGTLVLPLASFNGWTYRFDLSSFRESCAFLVSIAESFGSDDSLSLRDFQKAVDAILMGEAGSSFACLFLPPLTVASEDRLPINLKTRIKAQEMLREWAWGLARKGEFAAAVPDSLVDKIEAATDLLRERANEAAGPVGHNKQAGHSFPD